MKSGIIWEFFDDNDFKLLVEKCNNYQDVLLYFNLENTINNHRSLYSRIRKLKIDISHFIKSKGYGLGFKTSISKICVENSTYGTNNLKKRLLKEGVLENKCSICGKLPVWRDKPLVMILDHINGVNNDNRLENLRLVCPDCNSQLPTHCRGYKKIKARLKEVENCSFCGRELKNSRQNVSGLCIFCIGKKNRKVERPSKKQLQIDINEMSLLKVGKKYKVSDNSIRRWMKSYNIVKVAKVEKYKNHCIKCDKIISKNVSMCIDCYTENKIAKIPSKDDLIDKLTNNSQQKTAQYFNVTRNVLRGWLKKYNIKHALNKIL